MLTILKMLQAIKAEWGGLSVNNDNLFQRKVFALSFYNITCPYRIRQLVSESFIQNCRKLHRKAPALIVHHVKRHKLTTCITPQTDICDHMQASQPDITCYNFIPYTKKNPDGKSYESVRWNKRQLLLSNRVSWVEIAQPTILMTSTSYAPQFG
jgi:hypothetical protein